MKIEVLKSDVSDNHFPFLCSDDGAEAIVIDPIDHAQVIARVEALGVTLRWVINTHWHPDHTGGNAKVIAATGASLAAPAGEQAMIQGVTRALSEGDTINLGSEQLEVISTPGHTQDHITLRWGAHLFSGDTVFTGGAGNCRFGGDPRVLYATFRKLAALRDDCLLYPGHDYAKRNLEFCLHVEPDNARAQAMLDALSDGFTQTTLGEEKSYSPFWRTDASGLQSALQARFSDAWNSHASDDLAERAFLTLRGLRNTW